MNKYGMNKLKNECNMAIIRLTGINKIYRVNEIETQALENVNLEVEKGEFLSVMGPSGCGKSTLLNIIGNPEILLADEPTGNLDSRMGAEVMDILHRLNREDGRTIVMVTHNEEQARQTSRTIRFFDGRQVE